MAISFAAHAGYTPITNRMIDELNPASFKGDFSDYDQGTATFCGQLSDAAYAAYGDYPLLETRLNTRYGAGTFTIIPVDIASSHTRALICATDAFVVIAFRGTEFTVLKDLVTDVKLTRYISDTDADAHIRDLPAGHAGFRNGSIKLISEGDLFDTLAFVIRQRSHSNNVQSLPVYLTGHSMGAAYASIFVQPIARTFSFSGAYHFAPPLAISCSDAEEIHRLYGTRIYDIVNYKDYVVRAGRYCRTYMHHVGKFYRITDIGKLAPEEEHYVQWTREERKLRTLILYHSLDGYMDAIRSPANSNTFIKHRETSGEVLFGNDYQKVECED